MPTSKPYRPPGQDIEPLIVKADIWLDPSGLWMVGLYTRENMRDKAAPGGCLGPFETKEEADEALERQYESGNIQATTMPTGEESYVAGQRDAYRSLLRLALGNLGVDDPVAGKAFWVEDRARSVAALREICEQHGDNDWPDDLSLADVIEKHLGC